MGRPGPLSAGRTHWSFHRNSSSPLPRSLSRRQSLASASGTGKILSSPCSRSRLGCCWELQPSATSLGLSELSLHLKLTWPFPVQEQHVPFDIHTYGDQLVSRFPRLNEWCPFAELVAGQPAFEVCRSMLASLQLVSGLGHMGWGNPLGLC